MGISLFFLLYILAAALYPGGSDHDSIAKGFSLQNNYWCDLMGQWAKNGVQNPAQPIAIAAWIVLCCSLCLFWLYLPKLFPFSSIRQTIIQISGVCTSLIGLFIFTKYHDSAIRLSSFFGAVALIATVIELKVGKYYELFALGIVCFVLALTNYIMFTTNLLVNQMPVVQKLAFAFCLLMFGWIDYKIYQKENNQQIKFNQP